MIGGLRQEAILHDLAYPFNPTSDNSISGGIFIKNLDLIWKD
jgi:hypothetical protein